MTAAKRTPDQRQPGYMEARHKPRNAEEVITTDTQASWVRDGGRLLLCKSGDRQERRGFAASASSLPTAVASAMLWILVQHTVHQYTQYTAGQPTGQDMFVHTIADQ